MLDLELAGAVRYNMPVPITLQSAYYNPGFGHQPCLTGLIALFRDNSAAPGRILALETKQFYVDSGTQGVVGRHKPGTTDAYMNKLLQVRLTGSKRTSWSTTGPTTPSRFTPVPASARMSERTFASSARHAGVEPCRSKGALSTSTSVCGRPTRKQQGHKSRKAM